MQNTDEKQLLELLEKLKEEDNQSNIDKIHPNKKLKTIEAENAKTSLDQEYQNFLEALANYERDQSDNFDIDESSHNYNSFVIGGINQNGRNYDFNIFS